MINRFSEKNRDKNAMYGKVSGVVGKNVNVSSLLDINKVKVLNPFGITTLPKVGQTGVILPLDDGSFVLIGNVYSSENKATNEVRFESSSGAYIKLKANGDVEINSMVIAPNGTIR